MIEDFEYYSLDGRIRTWIRWYGGIPPVYFRHRGIVPAVSIFSGYVNDEYLVIDGVYAN